MRTTSLVFARLASSNLTLLCVMKILYSSDLSLDYAENYLLAVFLCVLGMCFCDFVFLWTGGKATSFLNFRSAGTSHFLSRHLG